MCGKREAGEGKERGGKGRRESKVVEGRGKEVKMCKRRAEEEGRVS